MPTLSAAPFSAVTLGRICRERRGRLGERGWGAGDPTVGPALLGLGEGGTGGDSPE